MSLTPKKLAVLISGFGSNLQAIIDACQKKEIQAEIVVVVSNKAEAYGLERAKRAGIETVVNKDTGSELAKQVLAYQPDWVVLAGWMRLLTHDFLQHFHNRVINLHPALPGQFPGMKAIERAWEAFQIDHITESGVMVHLVPDEGIDNGPVLGVEHVPIFKTDTFELFKERMHETERHLLVKILKQLCL